MSLRNIGRPFAALTMIIAVVVVSGCTYELPSMTGEPDTATIQPVNAPVGADQIHTGSVPPSDSPGNLTVVQVRRGDTLASIAREHGFDWHQLASANHIEAPYEIAAGQTLVLPVNSN